MNGNGKDIMTYGSLIVPIVFVITAMFFALYMYTRHRQRRFAAPEMQPEFLMSSIQGVFICYQCDTIYKTSRCPNCHEPAVIPLVRLTGALGSGDFKDTVGLGYYAINTHFEKRKNEELEREAFIRTTSSPIVIEEGEVAEEVLQLTS